MSKHTPGPWHVAGGCQIRSDRDQIAKVWMMRGGEGKANARLIAAAPDLLDALTQCRAELLSMIDKHNKQDADDGSWLYDYQTVVEADAAIAKALGEE